ncbi:uncharacterized protein C8A04DRAFT_15743 [Dichotomopilus funicola]|uniref:Gfo/Idh/MocA-like oxidoreductase N-terminal domain-containing protein n=1 Tax=Dichotomopilus funicola TaxID=1934379 RepID=A0AAN6ZIY7_9PEZI|nr:hypothetical protein C8A04DRAFT_15743 [Dichotomopilus funicola]
MATPRTRVALVGLSSSAKTAWASRAHLPYLLSDRGRDRFEIVALLNSSVAAADAAIAAYDLPRDKVRAYGDPAKLAADKEVDLVVNTTRVDKHYETVIDSVKAGKDAFVEWPLAQDAKHAWELADAAKVGGGRSVVGLQGVTVPLAKRLRGLLEEGKIGKVLSVDVKGYGGLGDRAKVPDGLSYFTERAVGGNIYTIGFSHLLSVIEASIGDLASFRGDYHLQRPEVEIADGEGKVVGKATSNVPDLILGLGRWGESSITQANAPLHYRFRRGPPFPGDSALVWTIQGEKGEIRIVSPQSTFVHIGDPNAPQVIEVHSFDTNEVEKVEWDWPEWQKELPYPARAIGAVYESYAATKASGAEPNHLTFADAARRHEYLDNALAEWKD